MNTIFCAALAALLPLAISTDHAIAQNKSERAAMLTGTLQKMIVANGMVTMSVDLKSLGGVNSSGQLRFSIAPTSFFTVLVFNDLLRGPEPSSIALVPENSKPLLAPFGGSANQLVLEKTAPGEAFDLVVRDAKTGFTFFNIEGHQYDYDAAGQLLRIHGGRLVISNEFAVALGHPADAGSAVGKISVDATMRPIEIDQLVNGETKSMVMPALHGAAGGEVQAPVHGPDVIVGVVESVVQSGNAGTQVGLAVGTDSCNIGDQPVDWFALPNTDHPVVPQNLYRMSGGLNNNERFEQIGQSWMKHTFLALEQSVCDTCNTSNCQTGTHLCPGCSDPYTADLNGDQNSIGSRAWVNPFTGNFPSGANNHSGHTHDGVSHRIRVEMDDLNTDLNQGATYFAEAAYISPHEYTWCQAHPEECNMYNNVSYRQFTVTGTTSFTFSPFAPTFRMKPAINAWAGATEQTFQPAPGSDGIGIIGYKITNPCAGVWHYEYAIYNENLDRGIRLFSVPLGCGVTANNLGFHAPPQEPGWTNDGTLNDNGYSKTPWDAVATSNALTWNTQTFAENQNANAIRWGTLYNFRFDSNKPPTTANATVGFFKTGAPMMVQIQAPMADPCNPLEITSVVSRKMHSAAGTFDINLPLSGSAGVECRSTAGDHTFVLTFTNDVVSGTASVTSGTGTVSGSPTFSGNTMTVSLTGVTDQQQITVTASGVMDIFGQILPDTAINAVILAGDTNGNRAVNAADVAQTKAQQGAPVDQTNFRNDVNANGTINAADVSLVKSSAGNSVP